MATRAPHTWRTNALILYNTKLGETDLIVVMLADDGSQIRAVAKGAQRPGSKLAGKVSLMNECDVLLARGRSLAYVCEALLLKSRTALSSDVCRMSTASTLCELARFASLEGTCDPWLFAATSRALDVCEEITASTQFDTVLAAYVLEVLAHQGWLPACNACIDCGDPAVTHISISAGGTVCSACAAHTENAELITSTQLTYIRHLINRTFSELKTENTNRSNARWALVFAHKWATTSFACDRLRGRWYLILRRAFV